MSVAEKLLCCIGEIDDFLLMEAETADVAAVKAAKRKRIVKYSVASVAGLAVSVGLAMAYWKLGGRKLSKTA
ncbi:MAG: hypothetical protein FWC32_11655 [Firmicutes bacterium]|nr:hypothetical protein [Bacillota bacterium]